MPIDQTANQQIAQNIETKVVESVIEQLQGMIEGLQSGDDSGLENIWEEICVQVQGDESVLYSSYERLITQCVTNELTFLDKKILGTLWLRTDNGMDWLYDNEGEAQTSYCLEDIASEICSSVLSKAADFENDRIYNHRWGLEPEDEDYEDDPDEDAELSEPVGTDRNRESN